MSDRTQRTALHRTYGTLHSGRYLKGTKDVPSHELFPGLLFNLLIPNPSCSSSSDILLQGSYAFLIVNCFQHDKALQYAVSFLITLSFLHDMYGKARQILCLRRFHFVL